MSEIIPLLNKAPSSNREVYLPGRGGGGGPPRVPGSAKGNADFYSGLKSAAEGTPKDPPEGREPGPYGEPRGSGDLYTGPKEAPTEFSGERYHGMGGERLSFFKREDGWYCMPSNPEADPVGPFPSMHEAADYFAPRGNR